MLLLLQGDCLVSESAKSPSVGAVDWHKAADAEEGRSMKL